MILHAAVDLRILLILREKSGSLSPGVSDASGS
jgi:hypothetical protein